MQVESTKIYERSYIIFYSNMFETGDRREILKKESEELLMKVFNPKISLSGLEERRSIIVLASLSYIKIAVFYFVSILLASALAQFIFGNSLDIFFSFLMPISLFLFLWTIISSGVTNFVRTSVAQRDIRKYKKMKKNNELRNFSINENAHIKIYDFFWGLLPSIIITINFISNT